MPSRLSALTDALNEWFQIHGKVVFTFAVFNILLIVFCVVYWGVELPMYPLNTIHTITSWFTEEKTEFPGSNILGLYTDISHAVFKFNFMQLCILSVSIYMAYILREMYYVQLDSQKVLYEGLNRILNFVRYEPQDLTRVVQGVQTIKNNLVERSEVFQGLLEKIVRIMPEHPTDVKDAVYSLQDVTEDLLSKIKREIRTLRLEYNASKPEEKEEMVELSVSSAEAPVVPPTITPKLKRGRKSNISGTSTSCSSVATTPLLGSTRLGSRRANEMIQQATQ